MSSRSFSCDVEATRLLQATFSAAIEVRVEIEGAGHSDRLSQRSLILLFQCAAKQYGYVLFFLILYSFLVYFHCRRLC